MNRTVILERLMHECRELLIFNPSDRPWQMPVSAAIASGVPIAFGAWLERLDLGVVGALGALTFLYLPRFDLRRRMLSVAGCAAMLTFCYTLGLVCHLVPNFTLPVITLVAIVTTALCRHFQLIPPGSLFFMMATAIGAYAPHDLAQTPLKVAVFAGSAVFACLIAWLYSLYVLQVKRIIPATPFLKTEQRITWFIPLLTGLFVALSLQIAELFGLGRAYWVPVSCLAVMQGINLRKVWNRQIQRSAGTLIGIGATWMMAPFASNPWAIVFAIAALNFCIETAVVRHYGFAVIFITPLTILLADAPNLHDSHITTLMFDRLLDTLIGAVIGFAGAMVMHNDTVKRRLHFLN
ncbi:FUSC family protein [Altericroceibacterium spongiae]|uniref:FUSC family protein n=1 Tax=Altericroceibacterium spongiae TaxID=2320269 RepID=A0A420ECB4_9SPHN|nr:FUSC family protein [Altericroceibacterium spongiae]RKF18293.1 FUSC family protein [Altericroceibacterium spongiae]